MMSCLIAIVQLSSVCIAALTQSAQKPVPESELFYTHAQASIQTE